MPPYRETQKQPQSIAAAAPRAPLPPLNPSLAGPIGSAGSDKVSVAVPLGHQEHTARVSKVSRRRAVLACVSCRARKVRCDVVEGSPCGNCKWDNVPCIIVEGRRQVKRYLTVSKAVVEAEEKIQGGTVVSRRAEIQPRPPLVVTDPSDNGSKVHMDDSDAEVTTQAIEPKATRTHRQPRRDRTANLLNMLSVVASADPNVRQLLAGLSNTKTSPSIREPPQQLPPSSSASATNRLAAPPEEEEDDDEDSPYQPELPPYVAPLPTRLDDEDTRYLSNKGALILPSIALQAALQQAYVEFVHPCLPLLDLSEFLSSVNPDEKSCDEPVSLLLYQAVMFAASAFVDMEHLRREGFSSRRAARRTFFQRTRLLYDFDYESDRLIVVQSLLLMTFWHERPEQKDTWHWTGVAISMAYTIGLHRSSSVVDMPVRQQRLWRRIWWSCVHRDRQVSLGMRRPIRIKEGTYDVPMLTESDFEIEALPGEDGSTIISPSCTILRDLGMQYELATICVSMTRLCICIGNVFKTQLNEIQQDGSHQQQHQQNQQHQQHDSRACIEAVDEELTRWEESLRPNCRYRPPTAADVANGRAPIVVQSSFVHMLYHTSVLCLHRPQSLPPLPSQMTTTTSTSSNEYIHDVWHQRVNESATHITLMASRLRELRLEGYLPLTGVSVLFPAMTMQLLEMRRSRYPGERQRAAKSFRQCMGALEGLRDTYAAADYATDILGSAFSKLDLDGQSPEGGPVQQQQQQSQNQNPNRQRTDEDSSSHIMPLENAPYMTSYEIQFSAKFVRRHHRPPPPALSHSTSEDLHHSNTEAASGSMDTQPTGSVYEMESSGWELTAAQVATAAGLEADGLDPYGFEAVDLDLLRGQPVDDSMGWDSLAREDIDMTQWLGLFPEDADYLDKL